MLGRSTLCENHLKHEPTPQKFHPFSSEPTQRFWRLRALGLPAKLLLLTAAFVMLAEVLIFVPSVANFRRTWLMQRVVAAKIASLALEASDGAELPARLRQELLMTAGVHAVSLKRPNVRQLVLGMPENQLVTDVYDLRRPDFWPLIRDGLRAFTAEPGRLVRVIGMPDMMSSDEIDLVIDETPLRAAVWSFAGNIFWVSLLISVSTAALVYLVLNALLVRPMMRMTRNMILYRENPEDPSRIIVPSGRRDEIGTAEAELASLQTQLSAFLREKSRLASIGLAVSKINHDLRNMLAGAQLVSDRLATVTDPTVQRFTPRLIRALDRAIGLCVDIIKYGRTNEAVPKRTMFLLAPLVEEVMESLASDEADAVHWSINIPQGLTLWADREHFYRILTNLVKNAVDVLTSDKHSGAERRIEIEATARPTEVLIHVRDNGPGVPAALREHLFKAFQTFSRTEGTGLGLVISAELIAAHGGTIVLQDGAPGAVFVVRVPIMSSNDWPETDMKRASTTHATDAANTPVRVP